MRSDGVIPARYDYWPYGEVLEQTADATRWLFTGHERDGESAMDNMGWREYDGFTGRFPQIDPLARKYPGISPYAYAAGNPMKFVDPDGRRILLGSWLDRAVYSVSKRLTGTGYKTENLRYVEHAAQRLKQSETGAKLYQELDARIEEYVVKTGDVPKTRRAHFEPTEAVKSEGGTITLNPQKIEQDAKNTGKDSPENAPAVTLGHELGHAKAHSESPGKFLYEYYSGTAEEKQGLPVEEKVREELKKKDDEEKEKKGAQP